jgi:hypothetical protein
MTARKKHIMGISKIELAAARETPVVLMQEGLISFKGRSILENAGDFYRPLQQWVIDYIASTIVDTRVIFAFEFINTSSTKWVYSIVKELSKFENVRNRVTIEWHYEKGDEELFELGEIIHTFIDCPFLFYEAE